MRTPIIAANWKMYKTAKEAEQFIKALVSPAPARIFIAPPFTAIFAAYVHIAVMFVYSLMYEKAFTIPENWRKVKSQLRVSANLSTIKKYRFSVGGKAGQFQKEIQRIPEIEVKVGDFHMLERESTPNFIMFVISSVASLLITFR